jgi:hypothetical protein
MRKVPLTILHNLEIETSVLTTAVYRDLMVFKWEFFQLSFVFVKKISQEVILE